MYLTGLLEADQITIPEVESELQAMARVREQIHGGAKARFLQIPPRSETCPSSCF